MLNLIYKKFIRKGMVFVGWPAKDLREDKIIVDLSKFDRNLVGIRRRRYGVFCRTQPPPEYGKEVEFIPLRNLWKTKYIDTTEQPNPDDS